MPESQTHNTYLTPSVYDKVENEKTKHASYGALRFFKPITFMETNFPFRITSLEEIHNFVDILHEFSNRDLFLKNTLYSTHEKELITIHMELCMALSERLCGRCIVPIMTGVRSIDMARLVNFLHTCQEIHTPRILEIGPGSGGVASLLIQSGYPYSAYEITQSLYIWLHHLLRELSGDDFCDWALLNIAPDTWVGTADLIPWWHMAEAYKKPPKKVDIIVCDRAIGEMEPNSFNYIRRISTEMLKGSSFGAFVFSHLGLNRYATIESVFQTFTNEGYKHFTFQGIERLNVFLHPDSELNLRKFDNMSIIPAIYGDKETPSQSMFTGCDIISAKKDQIAETYFFVDFFRGEKFDWSNIIV